MNAAGPQWSHFPTYLHSHIDLRPGISARVTLAVQDANGSQRLLHVLTVNHLRGLRSDPSRLRETLSVVTDFTDELKAAASSSAVSVFTEAHPRRALGLSHHRDVIARHQPHLLHRQDDFSAALGADIIDEAVTTAKEISAHNRSAHSSSERIHLGSLDPANLDTLMLLERARFPEEQRELYFLMRETSGHLSLGFELDDDRLKLRLQTLSAQLGNPGWVTLERAEELFFKTFGKALRNETHQIGQYFLRDDNRPDGLAEVARFAEKEIRDPTIGRSAALHLAATRRSGNRTVGLLYHYSHLKGIVDAAATALHTLGNDVRMRRPGGPPYAPNVASHRGAAVLIRHRTPSIGEAFPGIPVDPLHPRSGTFQRLDALLRTGRFALTGWAHSTLSLTPTFANEFGVDARLVDGDTPPHTRPTVWVTKCAELALFDALAHSTAAHFGGDVATAQHFTSGVVFAALHFDQSLIQAARQTGFSTQVGVVELDETFTLDLTDRIGWEGTHIGHKLVAVADVEWDDLSHVLPAIAPPMTAIAATQRLRKSNVAQTASVAFDPYSGRSVRPDMWRSISDQVMTEDNPLGNLFLWTPERSLAE